MDRSLAKLNSEEQHLTKHGKRQSPKPTNQIRPSTSRKASKQHHPQKATKVEHQPHDGDEQRFPAQASGASREAAPTLGQTPRRSRPTVPKRASEASREATLMLDQTPQPSRTTVPQRASGEAASHPRWVTPPQRRRRRRRSPSEQATPAARHPKLGQNTTTVTNNGFPSDASGASREAQPTLGQNTTKVTNEDPQPRQAAPAAKPSMGIKHSNGRTTVPDAGKRRQPQSRNQAGPGTNRTLGVRGLGPRGQRTAEAPGRRARRTGGTDEAARRGGAHAAGRPLSPVPTGDSTMEGPGRGRHRCPPIVLMIHQRRSGALPRVRLRRGPMSGARRR